MSWGARLALLVGLVAPTFAAPAAVAQAAENAPQISLVTFGPGHDVWRVWELFGHNMIRVTDASVATDLAYNFGMFDFNQDNFYWNFLQGRMWYWMEPDDPVRWIAGNRAAGRSVEIQDLSMTPFQARSLATALARNARPDQRFYRYQPFNDNCSTRVRDALNLALDGALERQLSAIASGATYRSRTAELTASNPAIYFGLMLLLGPSTDQPLSAWEDSFLPMNFARYLEPLTNPGLEGGAAPLVGAASLIPQPDRLAETATSRSSWLGWFLVLGVVVGGMLAWAGGRSGAGKGRAPFLTLAGLWTLLSGIAGMAMVYLWAFTDHTYAYRNENLLQASVLGLAMFWLLARWAARGGAAPGGLRVLALIVAGVSVLGVALQLLPWFSQVNAPALVVFVPANLGMALGALRATPVTEATAGRLSRP